MFQHLRANHACGAPCSGTSNQCDQAARVESRLDRTNVVPFAPDEPGRDGQHQPAVGVVPRGVRPELGDVRCRSPESEEQCRSCQAKRPERESPCIRDAVRIRQVRPGIRWHGGGPALHASSGLYRQITRRCSKTIIRLRTLILIILAQAQDNVRGPPP